MAPTSARRGRADRSTSGRACGERGAAAVEFAIVVPLLVLLLAGIVEFGRAYSAKISLQGAAREGARVLALDSGDPVDTTLGASGSLDPSDISIQTSGAPCTKGEPASVTASYPFSYNIPFFGSKTVTLTATGVMRCERGGL